MGHQNDSGKERDAIAAIREAVEANQQSLVGIDADILDLDDVVWRSPARPVIDPTDIIARLAEEADKVARGNEDTPPRAAVYRSRAEPDFGTRRQAAARHLAAATADNGSPEVTTEDRIRLLVTASLEAEGRIGADGKLAISEDELRQLVRAQIDDYLAQHMTADKQDALHSHPEMRTTSAREPDNDRD